MPSLGKDLAKIRSHLGLTVQDVQYTTKIPVSTIESIENDSIFSRAAEGKTYIRSFVRSYGRALKIDDGLLVKALDQQETGNYNHLLLQQFEELAEPGETAELTEGSDHSEKKPVNTTPKKDEVDGESLLSEKEKPDFHLKSNPEDENLKKVRSESAVSAATSTEKKAKSKPSGSADHRNVDWANMGRRFKQEKKQTPVWIIGIIILLIISIFAGYLLYNNGYLSALTDRSGQEGISATEPQTTQESLTLNLNEQDMEDPEAFLNSEATMQNVELDDVLYITVYAAYDNLDPVRVWSDLKPRLDPYWLEQGVALRFEFQDTIRIRAPYSNMLLFKNGHRLMIFSIIFMMKKKM
jgi:hypothetical protein